MSGRPAPTSFSHVYEDLFGKVHAIVDGGDSEVGLESTVVSVVGQPTLLRPGAVTLEELREIIPDIEVAESVNEELGEGESAPSPGMKYRHYAPKNPLILLSGTPEAIYEYVNERACTEEVGMLCHDGEEGNFKCRHITTYGAENDKKAQCARIYDALRSLDLTDAKLTFAKLPDKEGLGLALCNRLLRAAGFNVIEL